MPRPDTLAIARLALALLDTRPGRATMDWALQEAARPGGVAALAQAWVDGAAAGRDVAAIGAALVRHVGLEGHAVAEAAVVDALAAAGPGHEGAAIVALLQAFAAAVDHPVAEIAAAARAFNQDVAGSVAYAALAGTQDLGAAASAGRGTVIFSDQGGGAVRLTGDQDVRIDVTNSRSVLVGIDRDGDGVIELDGSERGAVAGSGWHIIDAYPRNPLDHSDTTNNFTGDLFFDGEGLRGGGGPMPAMLVFGFEPGADALRLGTALRTTLDDRGIDGRLAWVATDNDDSTRRVVDLGRVEALRLAAGDASVGAGSLSDRAAVAAALSGAGGVALRNAIGADALVLLEAADAPNVSALYLFRDGDGNDAVAAAELTLLGIVSTTGAGLASTDITLA